MLQSQKPNIYSFTTDGISFCCVPWGKDLAESYVSKSREITQDEKQICSNYFSHHGIPIRWDIGMDESGKLDKLKRIGVLKKYGLLSDEEADAARSLIERLSAEVTASKATDAMNNCLQKEGSAIRIKPIQVVKLGDIQSQLDDLLPPPDPEWKENGNHNWMIISPVNE